MSRSKEEEDSRWVYGKTEDIETHYTLGDQLGQPGQFGAAYLATHKKSGEKRAVKVIGKSKFRAQADRQFHFRQLRDEIRIMNKMSHPNVIKFHEVFESSSNLYIVMECCSGGELFDRIKAQPSGAYSEKDAAKVLRQIASGIAYMHKNRIAHCDLKPDNFLFASPDKDAALKIIDFGMSKMVRRREYLVSFRGTPYYVAPEVLEGRYSEHCDMWSFGVVMFVMLFGYPPFHANSDDEIFAKVKKGFNPTVKKGYGAWFPQALPVSDLARDLMKKLLEQNTADRLSAQEAMEHPWLTGEASDSPLVGTVLTNLKEFTAQFKFKQAVLHRMTNALSNVEIDQLQNTFKAIDADGNGTISAEELKEAMQKSGEFQDDEDFLQVMQMADVDGDGCISYDELCMASVQRKLAAKEERLWNAFCQFDVDGDGVVTLAEIEKVLGAGDSEVKEMIAEIDKNGDGKIDYDEFLSMWRKKEQKKTKKK
jgi:calcium-dependent protein kinase